MPETVPSCSGWRASNRARWTSSQAWKQPAMGVIILGAALAGLWYGRFLSFPQQISVALLLLLGAALLLRLGGASLLGPLFVYDLVRSARRGRQLISRSAY